MYSMRAEPHQEASYSVNLGLSVESLIAEVAKLQTPTYSSIFVTNKGLRDKKGSVTFGLADPKARVIIFSEAELATGNKGLFTERVLKEVAHLIGHLWGLGHCDDPTCVMHYTALVSEVDQKLPKLCREHEELFKQAYRALIGKP